MSARLKKRTFLIADCGLRIEEKAVACRVSFESEIRNPKSAMEIHLRNSPGAGRRCWLAGRSQAGVASRRPKKEAVQLGKEPTARRHLAINPFRQAGEERQLAVAPELPALRATGRERAKDRLRPGANRAVRRNQMEGLRKSRARNFRILFCERLVLEWHKIQRVPGGAPPAVGPAAAKFAIAVVNQQRFGRGRCDSEVTGHRNR